MFYYDITMKKDLFSTFIGLGLCLFFSLLCHGQSQNEKTQDDLLKERLSIQYKTKVLNFNLKEFDALFFEFFNKKNDPAIVLTKEEFYTYTVQIALFSDRLKALYPDKKAIAEENKKKWMSERYEDYLQSKPNKK